MNTNEFLVVLDRDGLLNVDVGYTYQIEDFKLAPGVIEGLLLLKSLGARFAIATGQSGIGKGKYTEADMRAFNDYLLAELSKHGISIEAVVFCPHDKGDGCTCRKPGIGMLEQLASLLSIIDWSEVWGAGDKPADSKMMLNMGGRAVLVESGDHNNSAGKQYWDEEPELLHEVLANPRNFVAHDLLGVAQVIQKQLELDVH